MTGNVWEWYSFKSELLNGGIFCGFNDAYTRTFEYIEGYYNVIRRHYSINYLSPMEFEQQFWNS